jgi:hypothetical protein
VPDRNWGVDLPLVTYVAVIVFSILLHCQARRTLPRVKGENMGKGIDDGHKRQADEVLCELGHAEGPLE